MNEQNSNWAIEHDEYPPKTKRLLLVERYGGSRYVIAAESIFERMDRAQRDYERIVAAVNSHDALVEACRVAAETLRDAGRTYNGDENWFTARRTCDAALALARGDVPAPTGTTTVD